MIFTLPYWVIAIATTLVKLIYSLFIGATLVFYVKYSRSGYASSIRWSRTGGILEMGKLLWCSYRSVPVTSSAVMAFAIAASFSSLFVSSILTAMISRIDKEGSPTTASAFTTQLISSNPFFWNTNLNSESTVEEALTLMFNDTRRNPNPRPRTRYAPRTFKYEASCDESAAFITTNEQMGIYFPQKTRDCKTYTIVLGDGYNYWDIMRGLYNPIDSSTLMLTIPTVPLDNDENRRVVEPAFFAFGKDQQCSKVNSEEDLGATFNKIPKDGLIVPPKTLATKCQYGTAGETLVFSATYIQFSVGNLQTFSNITASILDDPNSLPLLKYMRVAIDVDVFASSTNSSKLILFTRARSTASDFDFCMCHSVYWKEQGKMTLMCTYMLTSYILVSPQAMDPTIAADLNHEHEPRNYFNATNQIDITIHHLPQNFKVESQKSSPFFSVAQLIESTANVTRYLASLGHNVNIYKEPESTTDQLYILYDAVEIKDAYEVSTAALVTVGVLTLLFGLTFAISESFKTVYNSSIYKTIYKELSTKNEAMPMLMHHTRDPLAFDGNQVLHRSDDLHDGTLGSQDHLMVSLQRRSNVPGNQQERRSVDLPDESTVRCQRRNTCSTTKSTPAVNPATITSTTTTTSSTGPSQDTQVQPHENPNLSVPSAYSR